MSVFNQSRRNVIRLIFIAMFLVIILRLFSLQVVSSKYKIMADDQGVFRKVIYPDRGIVYDRQKRAILQNTIIYDLMVTPNKLRGVDTAGICRILEITKEQFNKKVVEVIIKNGRVRASIFEPLLDENKM